MPGVVRSTSRYKLLHAIVHLVAETEQMLLAAIIQCCHVSTLKNKSLIGSTLASEICIIFALLLGPKCAFLVKNVPNYALPTFF